MISTNPLTTQDIQAEAQTLGFFLLGVTDLAEPEHLDLFRHWLNSRSAAGMDYLFRADTLEKRENPKLMMPSAKSIIIVGLPYFPSNRAAEKPSPTFGRVASYAWGKDYHEWAVRILEEFITHLEQKCGQNIPHRIFTDSSPILERELAARAGLGWIGKNSCLIHPQYGSFFLLAEIFIELEITLAPELVTDHCGTCRRCMEACPTSCILPDRTIDAGRCISYLTIENKGEIPGDLQSKMGDWVFGCDICQAVCPWNERFAAQPIRSLPEENPSFAWVNLPEELSLGKEVFMERYNNRPVLRAKYYGWLRNCINAAGNSGSKELIDPLASILMQNPDPLLRIQAARALGNLNIGQVKFKLEIALTTETEDRVKMAIQSTLQDLSG